MKTACVLGAGGFIGSHMVKRLKAEDYWVRGVDLRLPEFDKSLADEFHIFDLRDPNKVSNALFGPYQHAVVKDDENSFDEVYQFAADMGGAGFIFTGNHDADVVHNSALINLNVAHYANKFGVKKIFFSSSACVYPKHIQDQTNNSGLHESDAYPAYPDSEYGWEKLFSERLYDSYRRNYGLNIRIARFHNIFGPESCYQGGREKAPTAICRKVAESIFEVEIWGDGNQTRSFLYIDECIEGVRRLMESDVHEPVNIGSDEMVSINQLAALVMQISRKELVMKHVEGPQGVRGRNSNNDLIFEKLGWKPSAKLYDGLVKTYSWVSNEIWKKEK